jgi:hypothetical protein
MPNLDDQGPWTYMYSSTNQKEWHGMNLILVLRCVAIMGKDNQISIIKEYDEIIFVI